MQVQPVKEYIMVARVNNARIWGAGSVGFAAHDAGPGAAKSSPVGSSSPVLVSRCLSRAVTRVGVGLGGITCRCIALFVRCG